MAGQRGADGLTQRAPDAAPRSRRRRPRLPRLARAIVALLAAGLVTALGGAVVTSDLRAASPEPAPGAQVTMTAEVLFGGLVRRGSWATIRVTVTNDGPAINGELQVVDAGRRGSTTALAVELPSGARQVHLLHSLPPPLGNRLVVRLVSQSTLHAEAQAAVQSMQPRDIGIFLVAEKPHLLVGPLARGMAMAGRPAPAVTALAPEDLPSRPEAWSPADLLVWQDVDAGRLEPGQLAALRAWLALGGHLLVLGGSTGAATLAGFPADILPFAPSGVLDVPAGQLEPLIGPTSHLPTTVPVVAGALRRGHLLAGSEDIALAARASLGSGSVALVGLDPANLAEGRDELFWQRSLPVQRAPRPRDALADDYLVNALGSLPVISLPRTEHVFLLIGGYIVAIGPLNYLLLRRRDRREWAWLTMPATIVGFAVLILAVGVAIKGGEVVVNELTVVRAATGSDRGLATVHVGVFSPSRATFDVRLEGEALVSTSVGGGRLGESDERPVNVLQGDPTTVRSYGVGFGAMRVLRAETVVTTPIITAQLRLTENRIEGSVNNASDVTVEQLSIVSGGSVQTLGDLAPGQTVQVDLPLDRAVRSGEMLAPRLFPHPATDDPQTVRTVAARRALVTHLAGGWQAFDGGGPNGGVFQAGPVLLGWLPGPTIGVQLGASTRTDGESVLVIPVQPQVSGPIAFAGDSLASSVISAQTDEYWFEGNLHSLGRGHVSLEYGPAGFDGTLEATGLTLRLSDRRMPSEAEGAPINPLPAAEQPDQEQPLAADPHPDVAPGLPRLQLLDWGSGEWVELEPLFDGVGYRLTEPARFVGTDGRIHVRFVNRSRDYVQFHLAVRLEGTAR